MSWEAWANLLVVSLVLWALARNLAGPDVVLMGGALTLVSLSLVSDRFPDVRDLAAAFGNEGVLTVAALYIVAGGLTETGGMTLLTQRVLGRPRSMTAAQIRLSVPVIGFSAFLNNTPVVAMFIPVVDDWCKKTGISPSKLFIPLSYAAVLGGMCTLIGTSTNLVVHALMMDERARDPEMPVMALFTLAPVGVVCAAAGLGFIVLASRWLLPTRKPFLAAVADARQYTLEMEVEPGSPIDGLSIERAGLRHLPGCYLSAIERQGETMVAVGPEHVLRGNDRLVFVGSVESVVDLQRVRGLVPATDQVFKVTASKLNRRLVEVVVSETNPVAGRSIRDGRFRNRYDAAVIAVYRNGGRIAGRIGDIVLQPGDTLLLQAAESFARDQRNSRDFLLVSHIDESRPVRHDKAWVAIGIMIGMVLLASFEARTGVGIFHASLLAAGLMGLTGCLSARQGRRSIDLPVVIAIVAALVLGRAVERSGLAAAFAAQVIGFSEGLGPWVALAAVYVVTLTMTELVTNNAAAALAFPLAYATAQGLDVQFLPFAVTIAIAASAGFATPLGYQTHLMVLGPGGYRFGDFARMGIPLDVLCGIITVTLTPLVYPFR
jgi:di/tricarboxylate transporter